MVRTWLGQALRASGVAILVPLAIVAAIALSVVGGGGSAHSLGQVLTGPAVPPAETSQPPAEHARDAKGTVPKTTARLRGLAPQSHVRPRGVSPQSHRVPVTTVPDKRRPSAPPAGAAPAAPAAPAPKPPPAPHPVHDAGTQVAQTVRPLPVAGPVAADAVQAVVDLVDPPM